ncbi:hypothetical protein CAOG_000635 [Capsaspora owczarzaki ATCC 30864]|uniref:Fatty acid hydroxylase domain-containing protein n=1 Tax=Capsaspora owczarzaki (strain ATCC 30864) TaxID=595528 RepID=A0A0D2U1M4_CAPO3|nr:hypothetical protein CAOG_000635 [Capsaspora owczarzaki ATCC 30864]
MSTGMMQQLLEMFISVAANFAGLTLVAMVPYAYIFDHYRIADIDGPAGWIGTILARDFAYYVFHYASHRCAALWAIHGVHHAPSEFNYGVNLAQGALQTVASAPFFAPLALFFNPQIFAIVYPMSKIYGFFTHTRLVGKPYLLQTIFVLPPAHRVHHAGAPSWYIDKNYGEVFTIWDRIFGTWQDEDVRPIFGHVTPMASWNPFESQFAIWRKLAEKASTCSSVTDKIWCFLGPPGWDPKTGGEYPLPDTTPYNAVKYDSRLPTFETAYCGVQYLVSLAVGVVILVAHRRFPSYYSVVGLAALVVLGVTLAGRLFDRTRQAALLEIFRLLVAVPVTLVFLLYDAGLISNVAQLWSGLDFWHTLAETLNSRLVHLPPSVPAEMVFVLPLVFVLMSAVAIGLRLDTFAPESDDAWLKRVWIPEIGRNFKQSLQDANIQFWKSAPAPAHAHADSTKSAVKRGSKQNAKKVQ